MTDIHNGRGEATTLFDRKLKLGEALNCRQLFADWDEIDAQSEQATRDRIDLDQRLTIAQAQAADAECLAALTVDGKNDAERKARKTQALRDDPAYGEAMAVVRDLERQRAELDATTDALRRKARRIERNIEYRIAALRMMGG